MSKEERKCDKCNGLFYDSPNPLREGQLEHFCSKTNGLIFRKPGFPKDLSAEATAEKNAERRGSVSKRKS